MTTDTRTDPYAWADVEHRREIVSTLLLAQRSYREIGRLLGVNKGTVVEDVKALRAVWVERAQVPFAEHVAEQLAKLGAVERALYARVASTDNTDMALVRAYLRCLDDQRKLLGLNAPARIEHTGMGGGAIQVELVDADALADEIEAYAAGHADGAAAAGGSTPAV